MASQNHAAPCALRTGLMKLNLLRWTRVTTRVSVVKSQIAGIAMRAAAQVDWRGGMTSTGAPAPDAAPRDPAGVDGFVSPPKDRPGLPGNTAGLRAARRKRTR